LKKLDVYVFNEMIVPFLIGTLSVVLMFQVNTYMGVAKTMNLENVPITAVLQYILFKTPEYLKMTLPVGTSLAAALTMTRLARESELTAMRAAGAPILRVLVPVAFFGLLASGLNFYVVEKVMPNSTKRANDIVRQVGILGLGTDTMRSNTMIDLDGYTARFGAVRKTAEGKMEIQDILLFQQPSAKVVTITKADRGTYDNGIWTFYGGYYWSFEGIDVTAAHAKDKIVVNQKIVIDNILRNELPTEMTMEELKKSIDSKHKTGLPAKRDEIDLQTRFSVPVACMVFSLVSPIFAIHFARNGGFVGVLVSFVTVVVYYNAFVVSTEIIGKVPSVPSWLAAWLPNIIFGVLGILAIRRLE